MRTTLLAVLTIVTGSTTLHGQAALTAVPEPDSPRTAFAVRAALGAVSQPLAADDLSVAAQGQVSAKSPGTSALLSFLITGAGQVYNEEVLKGGLMFAGAVLFTVLAVDGVDEYDCDPFENCAPWLLPVGLTGALGLKIWSIVDALGGAKRWNAAHGVAGLSIRLDGSVAYVGDGRASVGLLSAAF